MPKLTFTMDVSDAEFANLLARMTGTVGNNLVLTGVDGAGNTDDDNGPVDATAPAVDSRGMPWNADFHASTRGRNQDGSWKSKRGHDKAKLEAWEASIRASQPAAPQAAPAPAAAPATAALPGMPIPGFAPPQAAPADIPVSMDDVNAAFGKMQAANLIAPDGSNLAAIYGQIGLTSGDQLSTDETMRRKLIQALRASFPQAGI